MLTYQKFLAAPNKAAFIDQAVDDYLKSDRYANMLEAEAYYAGENPTIMKLKSALAVGGRSIDLTAAIRTPTGIFRRLVTQQVQNIWFYGLQTETPEIKEKLGPDFDHIAKSISESALLHGVCYGFWNFDRLQIFTALDYFPFKDERSGVDRAGVRFWRLDEDEPLYIQLFEEDGWTEYVKKDSGLSVVSPKQAYKLTVRRDALSTEVVASENYDALPVVPMYANRQHASELTTPVKSKIDAYDAISTLFWESVMRTRNIYWTLKGFSGQADELRGILNEIQQLGIMAPTDDSDASPHMVELPFGAVQYALEKLEEGIYLDFMGMQLSEITGGSLTNVAIQTAQYNMTLKVSAFEWQAFDFVRRLLKLQGIVTEDISFKKKSVSNDMETTQQLVMMAPYLDRQTVLEKSPMVEPDEVEAILDRSTMEAL